VITRYFMPAAFAYPTIVAALKLVGLNLAGTWLW
jgi:hypothetical protein